MYESALHAPIVVGVDGSEVSLEAVEWAAAEAVAQHRRLRVVHAFIWPLLRVPVGPSEYGPPDAGLRAQAQRILDEALLRARQSVPGIDVAGAIPVGAPVLLSEIEQAPLVVLGSRGLGGFSGLLIESTGVQVAAHALCPVIVVRPISAAPPNSLIADQVVVGVDGSSLSVEALEFGVGMIVQAGPRLVIAGWVALVTFLLLVEVRPLFQLDPRVVDISPFTHVPKLPGGELTMIPLSRQGGNAAVERWIGSWGAVECWCRHQRQIQTDSFSTNPRLAANRRDQLP